MLNMLVDCIGFDHSFVQCDHHMWVFNERVLPKSLRIAGGSDWFVLHRDFAEFTVGDSLLIRELRSVQRYPGHREGERVSKEGQRDRGRGRGRHR